MNITRACRYIAFWILCVTTVLLVGASVGMLLAILAILFSGIRSIFTMGLYDASVTTAAVLIRIIPITIFVWAMAFGGIEACRSIWKSLTKNLAQQLGKE